MNLPPAGPPRPADRVRGGALALAAGALRAQDAGMNVMVVETPVGPRSLYEEDGAITRVSWRGAAPAALSAMAEASLVRFGRDMAASISCV